MIHLELYRDLINILNEHNYEYVIDYEGVKEYAAIGIGDILFKLINIQEELVSKPVYINLDVFQSGYCKPNYESESQVWFDNPYNHFIFRINLLNNIINHSIFFSKKDFIFVITKFNAILLSNINTNFNYNKIQNYKLLLNNNFYNTNTIDNNITEFIKTPFIIFHTKLRLNNSYNYSQIKYNLRIFFTHLKVNSFNIIIMGEQEMPNTWEQKFHNITTIYHEVSQIKNINSNKILDLSVKEIYNNLDYNRFKNDICLINRATYNICFGQGGSLCSSLLFGKCIFFDPIGEKYFYKNTNLYNSGHRYFKKLLPMLNYLITILK
jgi:hypothetical protein